MSLSSLKHVFLADKLFPSSASIMECEVDKNDFVMPGDDISERIYAKVGEDDAKFVIGPGLIRNQQKITAVKPGLLKTRQNPTVFWIDSHQRRYIPINGERVVGTVASVGGYHARVDIGTNELASLSLLAFEGATKKNKPDIKVGDVVFARVISPCRDIETELVCITSALKREGMGVLRSANPSVVVKVAIHHVRRLLSPQSKIIPTLGKKFKFEVALGMNGRIWLTAKTFDIVYYIRHVIEQSETMIPEEINQLCEDIMGQFDSEIKQKKKH